MFVFGIPVEAIVGIALIVAVFTALIITVCKDTSVPQAIANHRRNSYENYSTPDVYERHYGYDRRNSGNYDY